MEKPKQHFLFNLEWDEILSELPKEVKYEVYDAIIEYAKSGKLLDLKPIAKGCFLFIKKELDYYFDSYEKKSKIRKEAGSKGGNASQIKQKQAKQANASFANQNKQTQANASINKNKNKNDSEDKSSSYPHTPQGGSAVVAAREIILSEFFSKQAAIEQFCMVNHTTAEELRKLAEEIFNDWELTNDEDISERHLMNSLRVKLRLKNANSTNYQQQQRGILSKLPPKPGHGLREN